MRYAYGVAAALLIGGSAFSLATGEAGAQVAQNSPSTLAGAPRGAPMSFADLAARLQPAVVNISTKQRVPVKTTADPFEDFFRRFDPTQPQGNDNSGSGGSGGGAQPRTREAGSLGSGFIISPDGYVVTNNHLIQGASGTGTVDSVTVITTDRHEYPARIIGRDETSDLALLKIEGRNLPFVNWGDSTKARVGDWIVAIGNPYGLGGTVTAGIISALHRGITGTGAYDRYIQTDAAINMGNSGGPMFDLNGNVIGINSALISPTGASVGIGLAIPAEAAKPVIDALRRGQRPSRGYLGVGLQAVDEDLAPALGIPKDTGRARPLGRSRCARRARRPPAGRRHRPRQRPGGDARPDGFLPRREHGGRRANSARDHPQRQAGNGDRASRRTTDGRAARQDFRRRFGTQNGSATSPTAPQRALGLSLAPLTPELARAANLPPTARGWSSPR